MSEPSNRGRPRGLSDRVREDVHAAVRRLLVAEGYAAMRLEDVAAAAGVHKSTLYRQWATKAQLVRDVLVAGELEHYPRVDEGSLAADVEALVQGLTRLFRSPTTVAFVQTRATADDPELRAGLHELARQDTAFMRLPFERAIARGELPPDTDVGMLVELLLSPLLARVALTGSPVDDEFSRRLAGTFTALVAPHAAIGP
ncbi:TetR/AcrR family transcriptional regulator [Blastococcus goldschmidtiae]|uniref:TetR/AcrR family transcriptional regulator n=1 Tax=Blastococcus goldschmidtiae TaxID=3075546 RepID=A0ABU2K4V6_9ACTN|nr:TetR/AcrR family transcriptional regulator [Blastococcus sp. DSM 46792]MDT0275216.1 TetR/AcrR family transcriptional regulator [Blastococcus sp. DSM 46792]